MADATTNALGGYMPSTVNPYGLKTILPNINTLYPPTDPSVVDRALRGEALFTAPNQRDQGEFVIGQIQNLLNTAERELSPGGDTTIGGRLRGYLPFLPSAQEQLKMAQPILTIPREGEQAETFGYRRAAQNLISTIEGIQRQQQSTPVLQDTTQSGYMQQGVAPWVSALATGIRPVLAAPLAGLSMMTTTHPYIGGAIGTSPVRKIDTGEGTAYTFPEPYLDYPGDTAKERLQEHITSLAIQNAITADDQPLTNIFRGDTGVGTDLQFTPEEAMTSNISNALIDYAYDRDVQPELQAITQLAEVDPTFNFEKYLDPASQEVMDITTQEESFSAIQEADQQRMERESRAAEASARQDRERQEKAAADARKAEESARRSQQEHEARANRIRKEASARDRQIQEDDRKAIARANADAERARNKEREEAAKRRQAVEAARLNKLAEAARKQQEAEQKRMDDLLAKQMEDMMRSMEEARRRRYTGGTGGALMWT